jgi:DUF4097 and DUF4098 domain-containing protein YvlB
MTYLISWVFAGILAVGGDSGQLAKVETNILSDNQFVVAKIENINSDETERFEQSYPFNSNGKISVSNVNGSITIEAWDKNEIKLEWVKTADDKERLADIRVKIDARQDFFSVETDYGSWKNSNGGSWNRNQGKLSVNYRLMVPKGAILNEIETVNGSVDVSNMTNVTNVSAVNGQVRAKNLRGNADLSTVNGTTEADFESLQSGSKISLSTVNGTVNLTIPSDANATIKADTVNGRIENEFGLPVRKGKYVGRDMHGRIGNGDAKVKIDSVNGGLFVKKRNDGKSQNPVVDLLPAKGKGDDCDDCDDEGEGASASGNSRAMRNMSIDAQKIANEAIAASKEAMKEQRKAMAEARKEMEAANREMAKADREMQKNKIDMSELGNLESLANLAALESLESLGSLGGLGGGSNSIVKKGDSFSVKGIPVVTIQAKNASVVVRGWDKQEISYLITKRANSDLKIEDEFNVNHSESGLTIIANAKRNTSYENNRSSRIEIFVPRKTNLKISAREEIRLTGVSGEFELEGIDEAINVADSDGKLRISNVDGSVRVIGFKGEVDAKTVDGNVSLEGEFAKINGKSVDGNFIVSMSESAGAEVESNADEIDVENLQTSNQKPGRVQIGKGGAKFNFDVSDGRIMFRNSSEIKVN